MKTPRNQIVPVLSKLSLQSGANAEKLGREIAAYLLDENRTNELDSLLRDLVQARAEQGVVEVTAVSAHELTPAARADIERQVRSDYPHAQKIIINQRIDMDMLSGVRLELIDRQLDVTARAKLNQFKQLTG